VIGQVFLHSHEIGPEEYLAPTWGDWLMQIADDLEAGKYSYHEEEMTVAPLGMYD
jgi:cell wall assembly regulator SMI1